MKLISAALLVILSSALFAQKSNTTYYKDIRKSKKSSLKKATYAESISYSDDSVQIVTFVNIKKNQLVSKKLYKNNLPTGIWKFYDANGKLIRKKDFSVLNYNTALVKGADYFYFHFDGPFPDTIDFTPAHYKTEKELAEYLSAHLRFTKEAKDQGLAGIVKIHLKIDKHGDVIPLGIYESVHPILDLEVYKLFNDFPNWTPSYRDGVPIDSYTIFPVRFILR